MAYYGIRENRDIDFVISSGWRKRYFDTDQSIQLSSNVEIVKAHWMPIAEIDDDSLLRKSEYWIEDNGLKIIRLELLMLKKESLGRPKDIEDIEVIHQFIENSGYAFNTDLYSNLKRRYVAMTPGLKEKIKSRLRPFVRRWHRWREKRQWVQCVDNDLLIMQHTDKLLSYQYKNGEFNRYDIVVRYMAAEECLQKNGCGFDLYKKMQEQRGFVVVEEAVERYTKLIKSIEKYGFDPNSQLPVDSRQNLVDGAHRLALALYFKQPLLPLKPRKAPFETDYSLTWFEQHGFDPGELDLIQSKKEEIFREWGLYFQIILWPPAHQVFDEIENDIRKKYKVLKSYTKDIGKDPEKTVFDIYASDDIAAWKIRKKLTGFKNHPTLIRVIEIEIPSPRFRRKALNNHDICIDVEEIKSEYRQKYKSRIDDYFYDIIMHIGDNFHHTREIAKVLNELPYV